MVFCRFVVEVASPPAEVTLAGLVARFPLRRANKMLVFIDFFCC
tara:strand:- start:365 stop:496 length:132 start_codon:yes stop_codon:yes gene_type:complete